MIIKPKSNRTKGIIASSFMVFALIAQPFYGVVAGSIANAEEVTTTNTELLTEPAKETETTEVIKTEEPALPVSENVIAENSEGKAGAAVVQENNKLAQPLFAQTMSANVAKNDRTSAEYASLQDAIGAATPGDTIVLLSDITITSQISINSTITLDGTNHNGTNHTITANFTRNGNDNDSVIGVYGEKNTATIKNIILNGGGVGRDLHGIDVYISNVVLDNLTIQNTARTAVQLNGSVGTISNINTKDTAKKKSWVFYSFNVITLNKGGSVTRDPKLTIGGKNSHNETPLFNGNHIRIESGSATDTNGQYTNGNTRNLINNINAPAIATPTQNQILDTNDVTISWNAITKTNSTQAAFSYNYKINNGTVVNTTATSVTPNLANGTHAVAVQAVSASGLESAWSVDRTFTVDANQLPQATITAPAENGTVSTRINGNKLNVKGTFTDDKAVNYLQLELVKDGNLVTSYTMHYNDAGLQSNDNFEVNIPVAANLADGQYNLIYTATDFENGVGPRTDHFFNIDNKKPTVTLVKPSVDIQGKNVQIEVSAEDAVGLSRITANIYKDGETTVYKPTSTAVQNGETAATHTASVELESGRYFVRYNAQDTAKNTSTTTDYYFTVDADIPSAEVTSHTVNKDALSFKGEVEDPNLRYYYYYLTTDQVVTVDGHTFTPGQEIRLNNNTTSSRNTETVWAASGQTKFEGNLGGFNIKNVPDGNYTINLVAYDTLGNNNAAAPATYKFYLDRTAPVVSDVTIHKIEAINGGNYTGIGLNGGFLDITFKTNEPLANGSQIGFQIPTMAGPPSTGWTKAELVDSATNTYKARISLKNRTDTSSPNYTSDFFVGKTFNDVRLYFRTVDALGNTDSNYYMKDGSLGKSGDFYRFTIDNEGPTVSQVTPAANAVVGKKLSLKFDVTDPVGVRQVNIHLFDTNGNSKKAIPLVKDASGDSWSVSDYDISDLAEGKYTFISRAVDNFGNLRAGTGSTHGSIIIDRTAPTEVKILSPATNSVFHTVNDKEVQLTAKDSVGLKRFDVTVWTKDDNRLDETTIKASWGIEVPADDKKGFGATFNLPSNLNLEDGEYVIYFTATDLADNPTNAESVYFTINTQAPKAEITVDGLIDGFTKNKNITITGTGTPGEYGTPIKTHFFELKTPGPDGETYAIYSFKNSAGNTCTLDGTNVCSFDLTKYYKGDGEYKIRYVVTDEQGIRNDGFQQPWANGAKSETFTFNVDTTRPLVTGPTNTDGDTVYNPSDDITITATDEKNGSGVKNVVGHIYKKDTNGDYKLHKNNSVNGDTLTIASPVFTALGEGEYYIKYNAHDNAGNVSKTTLYYFTIDTIAPEIKITSTGPFTTARPTIAGTVGKDATKVEILVDGTWVEVAYSKGEDTWSYTYTTDLANGDHSIQVRATDTAGNTGSNESPDQPGFAQATFVVNVPTPEVPTTPETPPTTPEVPGATPEATVVTPPAGTLAVQTTTNPTAATEDATVNGEEEVLGTSTERERSASVLAATDNKTDSDNEWSIVNAIAAVITVLVSIIALAGISKKQGRGKTLSIVTIVPAIGAVVAFFMLENLSSPMVFLNAWSWLFVGVLAVQVFIFAMTKQKSSDNE